MNSAHFCELWWFSLGKQARFTYPTFVPECPLRKVHELTFLWFGLPGPLLILSWIFPDLGALWVWRTNNRLRGTHLSSLPRARQGQKTHWAQSLKQYPLARNQYINNSPGVFSCIRPHANSFQSWGPLGFFSCMLSVLRRGVLGPSPKFSGSEDLPQVWIHVPHVFAPKLIPQKYFYVLAPGMCEYRHYINTEGRGQSANTYFKNNWNSGPKKTMTATDVTDFLTRFSPLDFSLLSPGFGGLVLLNRT